MKIKGFILPELMVVMIISTILSIFLWTGYQFVATQLARFNNKASYYEDLSQIDQLLRNDLNKANVVTFDYGKMLKMEFSDGAITEYIIEEDVIIRKQSSNVDYFYFDVQKKSIEYLFLKDHTTPYVNKVSIDVVLVDRILTLSYLKRYDRLFLFNHLTL